MKAGSTPRTIARFLFPPPAPGDRRQARVAELFRDSETKVVRQTHRIFQWLLPLQAGLAAIVALASAGPAIPAWPPVVFALVAGLLLAGAALALIRFCPDATLARHGVALAQIGFSVVFIQLGGDRIEPHFHVFLSLALLALYRDPLVLPTATIAIFAGHLLPSLWPVWSAARLGHAILDTWEHLGWLLLADAVLIASCVLTRREMWRVCHQQDESHQQLEHRVVARTRDLEAVVGEYQRTAGELQASERRHRTLISTVPIGIFETARGGTVLLANRYLLRLIGLPDDTDVSRLNLTDGRIFAPDDRERFWTRLESAGEVHGFTTTMHRTDGSPIEVVMNARLQPTAPGEPLRCEGTLEDVTARRRAELELETLNQQLVVASRQAGMAEVASGVLHNIGNVLTSVNLTVHDVQDRLKTTRLAHLHKVVEVLQREQARLGDFVTSDPGGRQLPDFLARLDAQLTAENARLQDDVANLIGHFEHIREIVITQQSSARLFGVVENLAPAQLFEDAMRLNADSFHRHGIAFAREFAAAPFVHADRHRVLQILVNLLKNAKEALKSLPAGQRRLVVRIAPAGPDAVALAVIDNGHGIAPENLSRIFQHGFTTKTTGHGFGLHSSVLAAREMGGDLTAASAGPGQGATFTLTLPCARLTAP